MPKLRSTRATKTHADLRRCSQCEGKIVRGESILVFQQSLLVPAHLRILVWHDACVRGVLPLNTPRRIVLRSKPKPKVAVVQELADVYHATRRQPLTRQELDDWMEVTAPESDLMRWSPNDSANE